MDISNSFALVHPPSSHDLSLAHPPTKHSPIKRAHTCPDRFHHPEARHRAGRPPEGQSMLQTLLHPFAPQRQKRHEAKNQSRQWVREAIELLYQGRLQEADLLMRNWVAHCRMTLLDIDRELKRGAPSNLHPVEEILRAGAYDTLLVLAPALKDAKYGDVFVRRSPTGFYIGEGIFDGSGPHAPFKAVGRGILVRDGQRTEGAWSNDLPNGMVRHYSNNGLLRCYEGQVVDSKLHGKGRAEFIDGRVLTCTWVEEKRHGRGDMTWSNGDHLAATWKNGALQPGGTFDTADGRSFKGAIDDQTCKPHGACSITWKHGPKIGARYEGVVKDSLPTGHGLYIFGSQEFLHGFQYEGPFLNGQKHGSGVLTDLSTETKHMCEFTNDLLESAPPERTEIDSEDDM